MTSAHRLILAVAAVAVAGCGGVAIRPTPTPRLAPVATVRPTVLPTAVATPTPVVAHRVVPPPHTPVVVHRAAPAPKPAPRPVAVFAATVQIALINADRTRSGLTPYLTNGCLMASAAHSAARMAAQGFISDSGAAADLACGLRTGIVGENVGWNTTGIQDSWINSLFMNSPPHRANVLGQFRYIGTAWALGANGAGYIAVEFG